MGTVPSYIPADNTDAKIQHDSYSTTEGIPNDLLGTGKTVRVLKTVKLHSTPGAPPIYVSRVIKDGKKNAYPTTNLRRI